MDGSPKDGILSWWKGIQHRMRHIWRYCVIQHGRDDGMFRWKRISLSECWQRSNPLQRLQDPILLRVCKYVYYFVLNVASYKLFHTKNDVYAAVREQFFKTCFYEFVLLKLILHWKHWNTFVVLIFKLNLLKQRCYLWCLIKTLYITVYLLSTIQSTRT